jgi:hypothetical protein
MGMLTSHLHLAPSGAKPLLPLYGFMVWPLPSATGNADHWLNAHVYTRTLSLLTQTTDAVFRNDMRSKAMCRAHMFVPPGNFYSQAHLSDRLCGLVVRVSGYRYRGLGFDSRRYQIF